MLVWGLAAAGVIIAAAALGLAWVAAGVGLSAIAVSIWIARGGWVARDGGMARGGAVSGRDDAPGAGGTGTGESRNGAASTVEARFRDLRAAIDAIDEAVLVTGLGGATELCNAAAVRLLGRAAERVLGRPVEELFTQVDVLGLHASAAGGRAQRGQVRMAGEAGPRIYEVMAAPLAWGGDRAGGAGSERGAGVVLAFKDVTELARAVSLKTDFVANASHEFRTPLSSIKAAVETLSDGAADEPVMRERFLRMISGNVVRLEEMTRDLLDLSRLESPETPVEITAISTAELAETLTEMFESQCAERRVSLKFEIHASLTDVRSDRRLLTLVLKNLIDNALKFAYEGTSVRVIAEVMTSSAAPGETDPGTSALRKHRSSAERAQGIRWQVVDRGVGIPLSSQARVFERFYQVDLARTGEPARRGTGLGLAIVKHAVKALGGTITVQSVWKEGTTMTVELPEGFGPALG